MKILHVTPSYYPAIQFGGPIQSVHLLNQALKAKGVQVDVFTTNAGLETSHRSDEWQMVDGLRVRYFRYHGYVHYNFSTALWQALFAMVKEYDLVHITAVWNFPVLAASLACRKHGIPYVISPRGTIYPETIALKSANLKKLYYNLVARGCLTHASAIHFTAPDERDKVTNYLGLKNPAWVIPNGLNLEAFAGVATLAPFRHFCPEVGEHPYLLFLGRISRKKGLDLLIPAFAELVGEHPALRLVIAGPDEEGYRQELEGIIGKEGLTEKIIFTGMLKGDAKLVAYRDADAFVLSSYSENFGMSVVEAMACRTPVIISDGVGIAPEIAAAEAGIVTQTTAESVYKGIKDLLQSPGKGTVLTRNAWNLVQSTYGIESVADKFIAAYQRSMYVAG